MQAPLLFHDMCPELFYVRYTTHRTSSIMTQPVNLSVLPTWKINLVQWARRFFCLSTFPFLLVCKHFKNYLFPSSCTESHSWFKTVQCCGFGTGHHEHSVSSHGSRADSAHDQAGRTRRGPPRAGDQRGPGEVADQQTRRHDLRRHITHVEQEPYV